MSINNYPPPHKSAFKGLQWDYDAVLAASEDECCYSLSEREILLILATIDPIAWVTRWFSYSDTLIDKDNLLKWQGNLARKLMSGCCPDEQILHRVTEDGAMEISTDGGATWIPDPDDPRVTGTQLPNTIAGSGDDKKCNAANNAIGNFKDAQAAFGNSLSTATTVLGFALEIAGALIVIFFTAGLTAEVLVPLIISAAVGLFGVLESTYNAEFTTDVWDDLTCDIFCTVGDDGQFDTSQLIDLQARVDEHFSDNVALTFQSILRGWGTVGLNNACIAGSTTASDCSGCDCGCGGEEVGFTLVTFHGDEISRSGCNIKVTATDDGGHNAVTVTWDGTHPWVLTAEGLIPPPSSPDTGGSSWQWYTWDGSEHGPFTGMSAPIGQSVTTVELSGTAGHDFSVSWDVATP